MKFDQRGRATIDIDTSGDTTVIAAPGVGKYIEIDHLDFLCSGIANTIKLKDGSTTVISRYTLTSGQGYNYDFISLDRNDITLSMNSAFVINSANGAQLEGLCLYRIIG